jgi:hypothetical protein
MTPAPGSANSLVYVSWNKYCPQSKKVWEALRTHCKGFHNAGDFCCHDRDGLDNIYSKTLDDMLRHCRLAVILLSAKHATSPSWWQDEVLRLLIPANGRHLTVVWQQINEFNVPPCLAEITPLERHSKSLWSPNKLNDSALLVSQKIKDEWDRTPSFSHALPDLPPSQPKGFEAPITPLPISHVALVISPSGSDEPSRHSYVFSLYRRHHEAEHYELLTQLGEACGIYTSPWSTRTPTTQAPQAQTSHDEEPPKAPPECPVLLRLLEWAQRQNSEFILEIFAPQALLHLDWGEVLVPYWTQKKPLVKAYSFLLRSWDRLNPISQARQPRLQQKWQILNSSNGAWAWVDGNTFKSNDENTVLMSPQSVAIQRSTSLARHEQREWLHAVLRSMVPLALWRHSPGEPDETATSAAAAHATALDHCQQALQPSPASSSPEGPDLLDNLAQRRLGAAAEALRPYAILVDHPSRRPALDSSGVSPPPRGPSDLFVSV